MSSYSRREFGQVVAAGIPLAGLMGATPRVAATGLTFGATTYSFQGLPRVFGTDNIDDVIAALKAAGVSIIELASANFEPAPPDMGPFARGGTPAYPSLTRRTPAQVAAIKAAAREDLREWRLGADPATLSRVRARFEAARIVIHSVAFDYTDGFTDAEIDVSLRQAALLGASIVSTPITMGDAARVAAIAARHPLRLAIHNQPDGNPAGAIGAVELPGVLTLSPSFTVKLDVGHITASNGDAVQTLRALAPRVSSVLVQDRLRNGGPAQMFGEGDTPITAVLGALRSTAPAVPVFALYTYFGLNSPAEEVKHCLEYLQHAG